MTASASTGYLHPTMDSVRALLARNIVGPVTMLNLLRFREIADYSEYPDLKPPEPLSGREAYCLYMAHTQPLLEASGGELLYYGEGGCFLIGPANERWDAAMLVRQESVQTFLSFGSDPEILAGIGHRLAALEDSRLLPLV